jgi:hypothetical protein
MAVAWFKPVKISVPVLPDGPDMGGFRESPKATFDIEEIRNRPSPKTQVGFTVHASRNGETSETHRTSPTVTVAKARVLFKMGWSVHIADSAGRQYAPSEFDEILKFDRQ